MGMQELRAMLLLRAPEQRIFPGPPPFTERRRAIFAEMGALGCDYREVGINANIDCIGLYLDSSSSNHLEYQQKLIMVGLTVTERVSIILVVMCACLTPKSDHR
mmetsp:Transcript_1602/g.3300  ORF Transcript_1602/g.3300 Transcript_1602/m.3300 type:complete len:104 (-) Transcript_1602:134-445(-)